VNLPLTFLHPDVAIAPVLTRANAASANIAITATLTQLERFLMVDIMVFFLSNEKTKI
jgi:hypothetical protein